MTSMGEIIGPEAVRFERTLPGPIERVWDHLVEGELRAKWFCGGATDPRTGGSVELVFDHKNLSPLPDDPPPPQHAEYEGCTSSTGTVTRWEPPKVFGFAWHGEDDESEVIFELTEHDNHVHLLLTHTKLRTRKDVVGVLGGWHVHLDILDDVLSGRTPEPFWRRYTPLDKQYDSAVEATGD